jgi:16S rRNA (uracil1498-N3)-methyltransferase
MATELGVTEIRVFHGIHSIAKGEKLSRWDRVVEGCVAQCGRTSSPVLLSFQNLEAALIDLPEGPRLACIPGSKIPSNRPEACVLLIGPEGGLHADELTQAERAGFTTLGLGELVLRCDTAVAAALGLVQRS